MTVMRKVVQVARKAPVLVATGCEPGRLEIWSLDTGDPLTELRSVYDGCGRFAISSTGDRVVAANWRKGKKGGIACYDVASGEVIWHRTDVRQVQHLQFSPREDRIWCNVESRPVHCLDSNTGLTLRTVRAAEDALDSPYSPHTLLLRHQDLAIESPKRLLTAPRFGWVWTGATFSPDMVCVSETTVWSDKPDINVGYVRCFELQDGTERWHYRSADGDFIQLISYQEDGFIYCVQSGWEAQGWIVKLLRLNGESGSCSEIRRLGPAPPYYGGFGNGIFVTPAGDVISLQTANTVRHLAFKDDHAVKVG